MPRLRMTVGGAIASTHAWSVTLEHLLSANIASQAVLQTIVNATATSLSASTPWKAALCSDTTTNQIKGLHYPGSTGKADLVAESSVASFVGTASPAHPPQIAVVASLRTSMAGRSYRGRLYLPVRSSNVQASGQVNSTAQGIVQAAAQAASSAIIAACATQAITASWVVWSPLLGVGTGINSILVGSQCDTVRRRNVDRDETYNGAPVTVTELHSGDGFTPEQVAQIKAATVSGPHVGGLDDFLDGLVEFVADV